MREIKFRVWENQKKRYFYFKDIGVYENCITFDGQDDFDDAFFSWDGAVLEQYTGLKDKNGKEIYEGDIDRELGVLKFGEYDNEESYEENVHGYGWYFEGPKGKISAVADYIGYFCIIGNIHENPEELI